MVEVVKRTVRDKAKEPVQQVAGHPRRPSGCFREGPVHPTSGRSIRVHAMVRVFPKGKHVEKQLLGWNLDTRGRRDPRVSAPVFVRACFFVSSRFWRPLGTFLVDYADPLDDTEINKLIVSWRIFE